MTLPLSAGKPKVLAYTRMPLGMHHHPNTDVDYVSNLLATAFPNCSALPVGQCALPTTETGQGWPKPLTQSLNYLWDGQKQVWSMEVPPQTNRTWRIQCQCPGVRPHRTIPEVLCFCLDVSELLIVTQGEPGQYKAAGIMFNLISVKKKKTSQELTNTNFNLQSHNHVFFLVGRKCSSSESSWRQHKSAITTNILLMTASVKHCCHVKQIVHHINHLAC